MQETDETGAAGSNFDIPGLGKRPWKNRAKKHGAFMGLYWDMMDSYFFQTNNNGKIIEDNRI